MENEALELIAKDLEVNDYDYDTILEIVREAYELGRSSK